MAHESWGMKILSLNYFFHLTDTNEDSKLVPRRICTKVDASIFFFFFRRVRATSMTQRRVENTRVHFWTFSRVFRYSFLPCFPPNKIRPSRSYQSGKDFLSRSWQSQYLIFCKNERTKGCCDWNEVGFSSFISAWSESSRHLNRYSLRFAVFDRVIQSDVVLRQNLVPTHSGKFITCLHFEP